MCCSSQHDGDCLKKDLSFETWEVDVLNFSVQVPALKPIFDTVWFVADFAWNSALRFFDVGEKTHSVW